MSFKKTSYGVSYLFFDICAINIKLSFTYMYVCVTSTILKDNKYVHCLFVVRVVEQEKLDVETTAKHMWLSKFYQHNVTYV